MTQAAAFNPVPTLADELGLPPRGVQAVVDLLDGGATVPFIARYRKEATGQLDEVQIRDVQERRAYLVELEERRQSVLEEIARQDKLTPELEGAIRACTTKTALEDLYLPYRPKRRTRAAKARERGLEPLARRILDQPDEGIPGAEANAFVDPEREVPDEQAALAGARDIVAEQVTETAAVRALVRDTCRRDGDLVAEIHPDVADKRTKFEQYYGYREPVTRVPSHRFLAIRRGERDKALRVRLEAEPEPLTARIEDQVGLRAGSPFADQLRQAIQDAFQRLLAPAVENDLRAELKERSDRAAVEVFAENLRNLLLSPPVGERPVVGVDPGLRTGCKCAAVDRTGRFQEALTIHISRGEARADKARQELAALLRRHAPFAVAVGNGTGSREAEAFVRRLLRDEGLTETVVVQVNESGASVYSASKIARQEFPELDVTIRGAISIARRLQDPLAELVKIEPKAIGVGQYQHDVHQPLLQRKLDEVVESCVNQVGVDLNTASASLLGRVAGIGPALARGVVAHRDANGPFASRQELLNVPKLGPRTFEQAAGFLRIRGGDNPLDASAVHPERYALVERMARDLGAQIAELVENDALVDRIDLAAYTDETVGEPTLRDILQELRKPGRDPRSSFEPPAFREGVESLEDLTEGMSLEGVVTNVTAFGAFVDVGVHQDGLVHISELADRYVKDPHEVVQVGQKLAVRVLGVDVERRRISLSARTTPRPSAEKEASGAGRGSRRQGGKGRRRREGGKAEGGARGAGRRKGQQRGPGKGKGQGQGDRSPDQGSGKLSHNPFASLLKDIDR